MSEAALRHLEGRTAIGDRMLAITGRHPSAAQTEFASSCMLHGRLFWESAHTAPLETRPLLLYYGVAAYAKALVMVRRSVRPQDLSQSHGLSCKVGAGDLIGNFAAKANGNGLFQEFNDVVAPINHLDFFTNTQPTIRLMPTAPSANLMSFEVTLLECFSRMPALVDTYRLCTGREADVLLTVLSDEQHCGPHWFRLRIDVDGDFQNQQELLAKAQALRRRFPFLTNWNLGEASVAWGKTILQFDNCAPQSEEPIGTVAWRTANQHLCFDPFGMMPPPIGGWGNTFPSFAAPIDGQPVSDLSLTLATLLTLSSLVRYHPHTWTACVHRRSLSGKPIDDSLLPLIDEFLSKVAGAFPGFVAEALNV